MGAERDRNEQAKTRWALDYYAGKLAREAAAGKAPARAKPRPTAPAPGARPPRRKPR
jgi:hypothetical protein